MRVPSGKIPSQPLTYMWERHYEIMRRLVAGDRQCDIASSLGMTDARLSIIVNSPLFQMRLVELRERANAGAADIAGRISKLALDSMTILEKAIRAKQGTADYNEFKPMERAKLSMDMLDRAGHGAIQRSMQLPGIITDDDIKELKRRKELRVVSTQTSQESREQQALPGSAVAVSSGLP